MQSRASKKLAKRIGPDSWLSAQDFAHDLLRAAVKHPLIDAVRPDDPARLRRLASRVRLWATGLVQPSAANRVLIAMATGGTLDRKTGTVTGGEITPDDWEPGERVPNDGGDDVGA